MAHRYSSIAVWLDGDARVSVYDRPHPDLPSRVVVIGWDNLSIHLSSDTDEQVAAAASLLIAAAQQVRDAALARIVEADTAALDEPDTALSGYRAQMRDAGRGSLLR